MMLRMTAAVLAAMSLSAASLPVAGPVPNQKPVETMQGERNGASQGRTPEDKERPQAAVPEAKDIPTPAEKPEQPKEPEKPAETNSATPEKPEAKEPAEPPVRNIVAEDPQRYAACVSELQSIGAVFTEGQSISEEEGSCGIEKPIIVKQPLPGIALSDSSPLRCEAALALSHWLKDTVQPAIKVAFPDRKLTGVRNAPSYACRKRNHAETGKISEHAKGNALDIIALEFDKGEPIEMKPKAEDPTMEGAFQRTATAGACLHFRTVLSPGSDATHEDHLHLDVLERKEDYRYCR